LLRCFVITEVGKVSEIGLSAAVETIRDSKFSLLLHRFHPIETNVERRVEKGSQKNKAFLSGTLFTLSQSAVSGVVVALHLGDD